MSGRQRFLLFLGIGAFAAAVNLGARAAINLATSYEAAIILAYPFGMTTAFLLNRALLFQASTLHVAHQYGRFALVNVLALAQIFLVSELFARLLFPAIGFGWHAETVAHGIGLMSPTFTSYWAHKHFTFARAAEGTAA